MNEQQTTAVAPWRAALATAESKMALLMTDPITVKKELGFAFMAMEGNAKLKECNPQSIIDAVLMIARTGLTLNPIYKFAYLVPRGGRAILDPSYQGLCKALVDGGGVKFIEAYVIYKDEVEQGRFRFNPATSEIHYEPIYPETEAEQNARKMHGVLTIAILSDGTRSPMFHPKWKIEKSKRISPGSSRDDSPWKNFSDEMAKKTGVRFHYKVLPKGKLSEQAETILSLDENNNPVDFSAGNKTSVASDILTDIPHEDVNDSSHEASEPDEPEVAPKKEPNPVVTESLKKRILDIKDAKRFVEYINTLTHLFDNQEFQDIVRMKAESMKEPISSFSFLND